MQQFMACFDTLFEKCAKKQLFKFLGGFGRASKNLYHSKKILHVYPHYCFNVKQEAIITQVLYTENLYASRNALVTPKSTQKLLRAPKQLHSNI